MEWTARSGTTLYEFLAFKVATRRDNSCWTWPGCHPEGGYSRVNVPGRTQQPAHRVAYELRYGPIPYGLEPDHTCRNRWCWNPDHIEPVTRSVNTIRGLRRSLQTHCKYGHPFTAENTLLYRGERRCRKCQYRRRRQHLEEKALTWNG